MMDMAKSAIVLCLGDKVLRDVVREATTTSMWAKLESLHMTKSLAHMQLLKQQLYSFKMVESKSITEQLTKFNNILDDLANIEVNMEDEDKALLLLCSLPKSFEHFKDTTALEEVQAALRTKKLTKFKDLKVDKGGEGLNVARGRSEHIGKGKGNSRSKSKSKGFDKSKLGCFLCHKPGHFKKDFPDKGGNGGSSVQVVVAFDEDGYESAGALVVTSWEPEKS